MRPMSVRQMHALCYERGIEFDPGFVPNELVEIAQVTLGHPRGTAARPPRICTSGAWRNAAVVEKFPIGSQPRTWCGSRRSRR